MLDYKVLPSQQKIYHCISFYSPKKFYSNLIAIKKCERTLIAYLVSLFIVPVIIYKPLLKRYPTKRDPYENE